MSNPNPFVPKGSLLEQQTQRRSRLKLAVFCVLAVSVTGLVAMLIQGCKRETPPADQPVDTNTMATTDFTNSMTNTPVVDTNPAPYVAPVVTNVPVIPVPTTVDTGSTEYLVVSGDTLEKIAKTHGVSLKALESANPGVDSRHLKIKQKIIIPAKSAEAATPAVASDTSSDTELYTIKSGDTLTKIAKAHGTTVKAIEAANNLTTARITVGKKLKIPKKAEVAPVVSTPVPDTSTAPATMAPATTPTTAPVK